MDKKLLLKTYLPFALVWSMDYFIKGWFMANREGLNLGWVYFSYTENHGIIMGSFSTLPLILKTVFLTTTGAALTASLPLILALYKFKTNFTLYGLALLLAGILGNVTDRVLYGYVVDYVYLHTPFFTTPVLNLADLVQWVGYGMLGYGLYHEFSHHYPDADMRSSKWIDKSFQMKFIISLLSMYIPICLTFIAFGFTFLKYSLIELNLNPLEVSRYLKFYSLTAAILLVFSSFVVFFISKLLSQRVAGPIRAIIRYVTDTSSGKKYAFKLRENDYFKEVEAPLTKVNADLMFARADDEDLIPELPEDVRKAG